MSGAVVISAAVEGIVDEAVIRRLLQDMNVPLVSLYGKNGKPHLQKKIKGYNNAAQFFPWLILVDLDHDFDCAPLLRQKWLSNPAKYMCFRIAVREVEAWLLADSDRMARFLGVARTKVPQDPEQLECPKETVVSLARQSKRRSIYEDMVPRQGSGRAIGPAYSSRLIEFIDKYWRPDVARRHSVSLDKAIRCIEELINRWQVEGNRQ